MLRQQSVLLFLKKLLKLWRDLLLGLAVFDEKKKKERHQRRRTQLQRDRNFDRKVRSGPPSGAVRPEVKRPDPQAHLNSL